MAIWFHGTTKENADIILENGFKAGTFFGKHLEDSIHMGGDCVFEVFFEKSPTEYWEYVCPEAIPKTKIRSLIGYSPKVSFHSDQVDYEIKKIHIKEDYDDQVVICGTCRGRGQMENYPPLTRWSEREKVTVCDDCNGHGARTIDGSDIYDHKR